MIDHDRLFKELLTTFFVEFLELFCPEVPAYLDADSVVFLDKELFTDVTSGERYEADFVARARFREQDTFFLFHLEHQAQPQTGFPARMFHYFIRLHEKYRLPVYPIALFSFAQPRAPVETLYRVAFPEWEVLRFNYRAIQLNQLNWRDFVNQTNPVASALMAKMRIAKQDRPRVKAECLRLLVTLRLNRAKMHLIAGFVDTYLRLNAEEEPEFRQVLASLVPPEEEKAIMETMTSWEERGWQRGLREEAQTLVLKQLNRRFGDLGKELRQQIEEMPLTQLESLSEDLLDFTLPEDISRWLDTQPTN